MTPAIAWKTGVSSYTMCLVCLLVINYITGASLLAAPFEAVASSLIVVIVLRTFPFEKNPDLEIPPKTVKK